MRAGTVRTGLEMPSSASRTAVTTIQISQIGSSLLSRFPAPPSTAQRWLLGTRSNACIILRASRAPGRYLRSARLLAGACILFVSISRGFTSRSGQYRRLVLGSLDFDCSLTSLPQRFLLLLLFCCLLFLFIQAWAALLVVLPVHHPCQATVNHRIRVAAVRCAKEDSISAQLGAPAVFVASCGARGHAD